MKQRPCGEIDNHSAHQENSMTFTEHEGSLLHSQDSILNQVNAVHIFKPWPYVAYT